MVSNNVGYEGAAEFYDFFADNSDIPFYVSYAHETGSPILDLAAGTLRVTVPLAKEGFRVFALEKSPSMLSIARNKLDRLTEPAENRITLVEGDMTNFGFDITFSLIIIPASFGYAVTTEEQLSTLVSIREHLRDDGLFLLDLYPGVLHDQESEWENEPVELPDGRTVSRRGKAKVDRVEQRQDVNIEYRISGGEDNVDEIVEVESSVAIIYNREADLLVKMAGFDVVEEFGGFGKEPYEPESTRRILVLQKENE
ncbi:MAG: methyltransferase domain-containing protein [Candidatus Lokiarchaeota archaeon]|nr:methyltransferase domain-containing protein [Candidatus Lokiarchaeota archaeon]